MEFPLEPPEARRKHLSCTCLHVSKKSFQRLVAVKKQRVSPKCVRRHDRAQATAPAEKKTKAERKKNKGGKILKILAIRLERTHRARLHVYAPNDFMLRNGMMSCEISFQRKIRIVLFFLKLHSVTPRYPALSHCNLNRSYRARTNTFLYCSIAIVPAEIISIYPAFSWSTSIPFPVFCATSRCCHQDYF